MSAPGVAAASGPGAAGSMPLPIPSPGAPDPAQAADLLRRGEELLRQVQGGAGTSVSSLPPPTKAPPGMAPPLGPAGMPGADILRRGEELLRQTEVVTASTPKAPVISGVGLASPPAAMISPQELLRRGEELMASVTAQPKQPAAETQPPIFAV